MVALTPVLAACGQADPSVSRPGPSGRLVVALGADPASLDPLLQTGLVEASVYSNIFDGLLSLDEKGQLQPALAESYRAVDDRTWQFKLRRSVTFHNGEAFDAASVRATVERMLNPDSKSPIRAQLGAIERVETPDQYTALLVTRQPFAPLLAELTGLMMLPPRALAQTGAEGVARQPVGTGPYRFVEWIKGERITLEAHTAHWRGSPGVGRLEFRPILDSFSRVAALRTNEVQLITNLSARDMPDLQKQGLRSVTQPGIQTLYVRLNAKQPPLDDVRVRRALSLAVNVDELIQTVYGGYARRVNGPYPPEVFGYATSAPLTPYDPDQARALLRDAGLSGGLSLTFWTPRGRYPGDDEAPQLLAAYLARVGVRLEIQTIEWGTYLSRLQGGEGPHLFLLAGTNRTFDPHFTLTRLYSSMGAFGLYYYDAKRIDPLVSEAAATLDPKRRHGLYSQMLSILRDDVPAIWLAQLDDLYGTQPSVTWTPRADSLLWMAGARVA